MNNRRSIGLERVGFSLLVALLLAPVVAHGLWRPLLHAFGPVGTSGRETLASLAVAASVVIGWRARPDRASAPFVAGAAGAVAASTGLGLGAPGLLSLGGVAAALAWVVPRLSSRLPAAMEGLARRHAALTGLYVLVALSSVVATARLSVFVGDPARVEMQALPGERFVETHSCLTAYVRAASLARRRVTNLYEDPWWYGSNGLPPAPGEAAPRYAPFALDNFSYPPTFLLLASPLTLWEGDFLAQRAVWFGLDGLLLALGLWVVARFVEGPRAHRVLLLAPLFFGSLPLLVTLQIGNFHLAAVMLAMLAMVAVERGRATSGGAMLALSVLSKISPGILGLLLLARGRARLVGVMAAVGALLLAATAMAFGTDPITSFVRYALPRLSSGRAFPFLETTSGVVTNLAPFGIPFKLQRLGLFAGDPWAVAPWVGRAWTVGLVALVGHAARRRGDRREQAVVWMALLTLAALQSPFAAAYAAVGLLWATTLLAVEVRGLGGALALVGLWLAILVVPPGLRTEVKIVQSLAQTAVTTVACVWLVVRHPRAQDAPTGAPDEGLPRRST